MNPVNTNQESETIQSKYEACQEMINQKQTISMEDENHSNYESNESMDVTTKDKVFQKHLESNTSIVDKEDSTKDQSKDLVHPEEAHHHQNLSTSLAKSDISMLSRKQSVFEKTEIYKEENDTSNNSKEVLNNFDQVNADPKQESITCDMCGNNFKQKQYLNLHIRSIHKGKHFECKMCNSKFSQKGSLNGHIASVHQRKKPFD